MKLTTIFKSLATVTIFAILARLIGFGYKIYIARAFGAETVGIYQICLTFLMLIIAITSTGIPLIISKKTAEFDNPHNAMGIITSGLILSVSLAIISIVIIGCSSSVMSVFLPDESYNKTLTILMPMAITTAIFCCLRAWFWGKKSFLLFSSLEFMEELLKVFFTFILFRMLISVINKENIIAYALLLTDISALIVIIFLFIRAGGKLSKPTHMRELIKSSAPLTANRIFSSGVTTLVTLLIPQLLIHTGLLPSEATATFGRFCGMAVPILMAPATLTSSLGVVLFPEFAKLAQTNPDKLHSSIEIGLNYAIIIGSIFSIITMVFGREIGLIIFNDAEAGQMIQYASILTLPICLSSITAPTLNSIGLEKQSFVIHIIGSALLLLSIIFLTESIGIFSLAVGYFLNFCCVFTLANLTLKKKLGKPIQFTSLLLLSILAVGFSVLLSYNIYILISRILPMIVSILISIIISLSIYFGIMAILSKKDTLNYKTLISKLNN